MTVIAASSSNWQQPEHYAHLRRADRRMFAWEWLRRAPAYRRAWTRYGGAPQGRLGARVARLFGLIALEDPAQDARTARPVWTSDRDPHVVSADAKAAIGDSTDLFDILVLVPVASIAVTSDGNEHWLFSDGEWLLRLDVIEGTLLGGPALLRYRLHGLTSLTLRLQALGDLVDLMETPVKRLRPRSGQRPNRWIAELRTADALAEGASHRQIAANFYGGSAGTGWRQEHDAYRLRVQRLTRIARQRLRWPLSNAWFEQ